MDALPAGTLTSKRDLVELQCILYEALLGSRRVRGTSAIVTLVKGRKGKRLNKDQSDELTQPFHDSLRLSLCYAHHFATLITANLQKVLASRRKRGATNKYVPKIQMPRYCRVNHLLCTNEEAQKVRNGRNYTTFYQLTILFLLPSMWNLMGTSSRPRPHPLLTTQYLPSLTAPFGIPLSLVCLRCPLEHQCTATNLSTAAL